MNTTVKILVLGCCTISLTVQAKELLFVETDFNTFVVQAVPSTEQNGFKAYFNDLQQKIAKLDQEEQRQMRRHMYDSAFELLAYEHRAWANDIRKFLSNLQFLDESFDHERTDVRTFLSWYGAYKEYRGPQKTRVASGDVAAKENFWRNVKTQVTKAADKIGNWLRSLKKTVMA